MSISKEQRKRYPSNWKDISQRIRFDRARGVCEWCGKPHMRRVIVLPDGRWALAGVSRGHFSEAFELDRDRATRATRAHYLSAERWQGEGSASLSFEAALAVADRARVIRVVLTCAHLNHTPEDCRDENLAALCQRCHLAYDAAHRAAIRRSRRLAQTAGRQLPLPAVPEAAGHAEGDG